MYKPSNLDRSSCMIPEQLILLGKTCLNCVKAFSNVTPPALPIAKDDLLNLGVRSDACSCICNQELVDVKEIAAAHDAEIVPLLFD